MKPNSSTKVYIKVDSQEQQVSNFSTLPSKSKVIFIS